jgi:hypothetical protein
MSSKIKRNLFNMLLCVTTVIVSSSCYAEMHHGREEGHQTYHGRHNGSAYHGRHDDSVYHGRGYYHDYRERRSPNVVIGLPFQIYDETPFCEDVRVCNSRGRCWIETYCD